MINDGGQLYEDATDRKPPLVPYVYAATFAFFETTALWSVRVVAMLAVALTALLLAIEARRRYGTRAGWIAGILFVVAMVAFAPQDGQAANFEVFMLPSMTAAVLFARRGRGFARRRRDRRRDVGQTDGRGHAPSGPLPPRARAREAGSRRGLPRLHHPDRAGRVGRRPGATPLLDGAGQRVLRRHEDDVDRRAHDVRLHDRHVGAVQPAAAVEDPERMATDGSSRARR